MVNSYVEHYYFHTRNRSALVQLSHTVAPVNAPTIAEARMFTKSHHHVYPHTEVITFVLPVSLAYLIKGKGKGIEICIVISYVYDYYKFVKIPDFFPERISRQYMFCLLCLSFCVFFLWASLPEIKAMLCYVMLNSALREI